MGQALMAAFFILVAAGVARADVAYPYASVVCQGNQALVRFVYAYNGRNPIFVGAAAHLPDPVGRALDVLAPTDPSQCTLADGRRIVLRQGSPGDANGYGQCGADNTELFSLWVGRKLAYQRQVWHPKCEYPLAIRALVVDGDTLKECHVLHHDLSQSDEPIECVDQSSRLVGPSEPDFPGRVVVVESAPDMQAFCQSLIKDQKLEETDHRPEEKDADPDVAASLIDEVDALLDRGRINFLASFKIGSVKPPFTPWTAWPTYQRTGLQEILSHRERERLIDQATRQPFDLNNSGTLSVSVCSCDARGSRAGGDHEIWSLLPQGASLGVIEKRQAQLRFLGQHGELEKMRASGIIVFGGDQTAFHTASNVLLTPFRRDGVTWFLARTDIREAPVTDIVLRPTPKGGLDQVCAFHANPPY